jgi:hypothetical protein
LQHEFNLVTQAKGIEAIRLEYTVKKAEGWYVETGPFKTQELARMARESLKNNQLEPPKKTT